MVVVLDSIIIRGYCSDLKKEGVRLFRSRATTLARDSIMMRWTALMALLALGLVVTGCSDNNDGNNATNNGNNTKMDMNTSEDMTSDMVGDTSKDMPVEEDMPMVKIYPNGERVSARGFAVFPPIPTSCDNPGGSYRIPFTIATEKVRPAVEGDKIGGRTLVPNKTVTIGSISSRRTRVSEISEVTCENNAECGPGFVCAPAGTQEAILQCTHQTGLSFVPQSVKQDYDTGKGDKKQLVTLLMENSGGMLGFTPLEVGRLYGEGNDAGKDLLANDLRATDKDLKHRETVKQFLINLASVASSANTKMSAWWFAGDDPTEAVPFSESGNQGLEDNYTSDLSQVVEKVKDLPIPSARLGTGNVYQAIMRVLQNDLSLSKYKDYEKFLFLVVDGPNEVWDPDATQEKVLAELQKHNIHLFIVHFDGRVDDTVMRDPLAYWAGGQRCRMDNNCAEAPACATNSDCDAHEECRKPKVYAENEGDPVTEAQLSYCLPKYRSGRLGPINAYADMACRTGGNYIYVGGTDQLRPPLRALPSVVDGQWSVEANISYLDRAKGAGEGFFRLSGTFVGAFGNASIGDTLSATIPSDDPLVGGSVDNRPIVRVGQPKGK